MVYIDTYIGDHNSAMCCRAVLLSHVSCTKASISRHILHMHGRRQVFLVWGSLVPGAEEERLVHTDVLLVN